MLLRDSMLDWSTLLSEHNRPFLKTEAVPLSDADTRKLESTMHRMFGLRASECVGHVPSETPLDPNFQYPAWLVRDMN